LLLEAVIGEATEIQEGIYQYNISNNSWSKAGNLPEIAREKAVSFNFNNEVYFGLGENDSGLLSNFWKIKIE
jgi:N-acetylneuraminic acid mutarotase